MIVTILWMIALGVVIVIAISAMWAGLRAAPFVPTFNKDVDRMVELAQLKDGDHIVDIGAGDARILIAAAKQKNITGVGYELSLGMFLVGWLRIRLAGLHPRLKMVWGDFFHRDLSGFQAVLCFLTPPAMAKLEPKLKAELKPGTRVVSAVFPLPTWVPISKDKSDANRVSIWVYRV